MEELDLKELLSVFWRKKWIVVVIIMLITFAGIIYSYNFVEAKYKSSTTILILENKSYSVETITSEDSNEEIIQYEISRTSNLISNCRELIKSKTFVQAVIDNLKINENVGSIINSITVSTISGTDSIEITVTNANSEIASKIANEVANVFSKKIKEVYDGDIEDIYVIDEAVPSAIPYNINHKKDISVAFILSVVLACAFVIVCYFFDNKIRTSKDIKEIAKLKNLVNIPIEKNKKLDAMPELVTFLNPNSVTSEAFRMLRTNAQFFKFDSNDSKTFLVSSCFEEDEKSYVCANFAITFAQIGKKVVLIDSDVKHGIQSKLFNIPNVKGLSNYLSNLDENGIKTNEDLGKIIYETNIKNLNLITSGTCLSNFSELLLSSKLQEMIEFLKNYYDVIIFDGAPITPATDSLILAKLLDNTILVTKYNKTKKADLQKAKECMENVSGKIVGTCINSIPIKEYKKDKYYCYNLEKENFKSQSIIKEKIKTNIDRIFYFIKNKINRENSRFIPALPEYNPRNQNEIISKQEKNKINYKKSQTIKEEEKNNRYKEKNIKQNIRQDIEQTAKEEKNKNVNENGKESIQEDIQKAGDSFKKDDLQKEKIFPKIKENITGFFCKAKTNIKKFFSKSSEKIKNTFGNCKEKIKNSIEAKKKEKIEKQEAYQNQMEEKIIEEEKIEEQKADEYEKSKNEKEIELENKRRQKEFELEENRKQKEIELKEKRKQKEFELEEKRKQKEFELEEKKKQREFELEEKRKQKEFELESKKKHKEEKRKIREEELENIKREKEVQKRIKNQELEKMKNEKEKARAIQKVELEEKKKQKELEQYEQKKIKEEENKKKEIAKEQEKKEAKYTDEYLEENLYPKTKNTKLF
jgi:capsular exopolysaccharide synthesis family protein